SIFGFVVQANAFRFDGDAALALQIHGVEHLFVHLAFGKRSGHFEQTVGQRGFAVVDVRDDAEIAYEFWIHVTRLSPSDVFHLVALISISRETPAVGKAPALGLLLTFSITGRSRFF